ncbi:Hvo_1808 family surface protein [Natrarchaeobaculum aegyptiacum]|uniref:DUF4157 domain-containing protein n=1 Tax=Natrarchaeobaculum aegyptiacum TaxID=745377 RepID=A0A2Z2HR05_9EURY|nr:Hvo_1808 family surface protein [Natrarchaeobaculum aegyptiacum]ARS89590.1 hypothetical protein B1756_07455 [Natrarchaeobaculum aegyptiacum]
MHSSRNQVLAILAVAAVALLAVALASGALFAVLPGDGPNLLADDRPDEPSTSETVGYVEGYWYDDDLPVDDRDSAALTEDELEAVVYRSMARVEHIRGLTFQEEVPVEVLSRDEFQEEADLFGNVTDEQRLHQNVYLEALFLADRETPADSEVEALYDGTVGGYYDPATNEIVLVAEDPDEPETDEIVLGHELLHALQDQHFDLSQYDRETIDQDAAKNGLIEGDAVWVETEYADRCASEWDCLEPSISAGGSPAINWGLYLIVLQPYDDGPDYVDHLLEEGGWDAVDAAYDEPPASSSEIIRPGDEREPVSIDVADRSSDEWRQYEIDGAVANETLGEVGKASMFAAGAVDPARPGVVSEDAFFEGRTGVLADLDYDQPYTDGWAGDEFVTYVHEDADATDDPLAAVEHSGFVWQSEWVSEDDAAEFVDGYEQLLEYHGAEEIEVDGGDADVYEIDENYPGAYAITQDDETVTIVRAPSVDDLEDVDAGAVAGE